MVDLDAAFARNLENHLAGGVVNAGRPIRIGVRDLVLGDSEDAADAAQHDGAQVHLAALGLLKPPRRVPTMEQAKQFVFNVSPAIHPLPAASPHSKTRTGEALRLAAGSVAGAYPGSRW